MKLRMKDFWGDEWTFAQLMVARAYRASWLLASRGGGDSFALQGIRSLMRHHAMKAVVLARNAKAEQAKAA